MFDQQIELIVRKNLDCFPLSKNFLYYSEFEHLGKLDEPYRNYFICEVNYWLFQLRQYFESLHCFDTQSEEFNRMTSTFLEQLKPFARYSPFDFENSLRSAVALHCNFLILPRTTLLNFIFSNSLNKSCEEILLKLDFFVDYTNLIENLRNDVLQIQKQYRQQFISIFEFEKIILDRVSYCWNLREIPSVLTELAPLFKFFGQSGEEFSDSEVPTIALSHLFDDLGFRTLSNYFNFINSKKERIKFSELEQIFSEPQAQSITSEVTKAEKEQFPVPSRAIFFDDIHPTAFVLPKEIQAPKYLIDELQEAESESNLVASESEKAQIQELLQSFETKVEAIETDFNQSQEREVIQTENAVVSEPQSANFGELVTGEQEDVKKFELTETIEPGIVQTEEELSQLGTDFENEQQELANLGEIESEEQQEFERIEVSETIAETKRLSELIDPETRAKFIEQLFYSLEDEYENLISRIDQTNDINQAMEMFKEFMEAFGIFESAPIVTEFKSFIEKKFSN